MNASPPAPRLRWDIFCHVIDNFGDLGVCWRLAVNLAQRGQDVRLWVDQPAALAWLAPDAAPGVQVRHWRTPFDRCDVMPGDVLIEAFGCQIDPEFIAAYADHISAGGQKCLWINLEYLTAEAYAQRCHGLPSPVMAGAGRGLTKHFFYPGFTRGTGGLLRELDLLARQANFDRSAWLAQWQTDGEHTGCAGGSCGNLPDRHAPRLVSLFCYEPAVLRQWLGILANEAQPTLLLVTAGRASAAVKHMVCQQNAIQPNWNKRGMLSLIYLPALTQWDYDHLLWACDVNFVRGEDSLVRALWAGKPLVWQIYPQDDRAHLAKLDAFLDWLHAPASLRAFHHLWNSPCGGNIALPGDLALPPDECQKWQQSMSLARQQLLTQIDLANQLLRFTTKTN